MSDLSYYGRGGGSGGDNNDNNSYNANTNSNTNSRTINKGNKSYIIPNNNRNNMNMMNRQQQTNVNNSVNSNNNPDNTNNNNNQTVKASKASDHCKIFVGGLSWQTTEESLRWHFEQYGQVVSVEVMRDRNTGDPRGFAFIVFADPATLDLVMADADQHEINHKFVDVKRAQARGIAPPSIHEKGGDTDATSPAGMSPIAANAITATTTTSTSNVRKEGGGYSGSKTTSSLSSSTVNAELTPEQMQTKVFVGGIPPSVDREELKVIFSQFGPVVDSIVMVDQVTQRSRCFGFITFDSQSSAQKAIVAQPITVQGRQVEVKLATPRGNEQSQPQQHQQKSGGNQQYQQQQQQQQYTSGPQSGTGNTGYYQSSAGGATGDNVVVTTKTGKRVPAPGHLGLRAGKQSLSNATSEYAGLAVAYGRSGWKAGYGTKAFGKAGWAVEGWEDTFLSPPEKVGFSFEMLRLVVPKKPPTPEPPTPPPPLTKNTKTEPSSSSTTNKTSAQFNKGKRPKSAAPPRAIASNSMKEETFTHREQQREQHREPPKKRMKRK